MANELMTTVPTTDLNPWAAFINKIPENAITQNAPALIIAGSALIAFDRYLKYKERKEAMAQGYNCKFGDTTFTKGTAIAS